jgi:signal transduction histidine kinase/ligand-binding sensor domain-containing protein
MRAVAAPLFSCLAAAVVWSPCAHAADSNLHFERIGTAGGPPSEVVTAIHQDRDGFVWIGTRDGLVLYDGHSFTTLEHDPADPGSISDDTIRTIHESRDGTIWIGTNTGGLNRLDRERRTFTRFRHDSAHPDTLSHDSVYAIAEDGDGRLWIGTQRGLNRLDTDTGAFERFMPDPERPGSLSHPYVGALLGDSRGRIWVGTVGGGLNLFDPASGTFRIWRHDPAMDRSIGDDRVFALLEGPDGALWVGTNDGLDRMDPETGTFDPVGRGNRGSEMGLAASVVTTLARAPDGKLWIGTFGGGLHEFDPASGRFRTFRHDPGRSGSLPADRVVGLVTDRSGALWVGTWGGGLSRVSSSAVLLSSAAREVREPPDLDDADVTALASDRSGALWIATRRGWLLRKDASSEAFQVLRKGGGGSIFRILPTRDGGAWVGTSRGLLRFGSIERPPREFEHDPADPTSLGPGFVVALLQDREGRVWVGTGEGGVQEIDPTGRVRRRFVHDPTDPGSLSDDYVTSLHQDRWGTVWVGTRSGGLNALDPSNGRVTRYPVGAEDPSAIRHHHVTAILEDSRGRLWVATSGGGLHWGTRNGPGERVRFSRATAADGLIDNSVMAILEDDDGSVWVSTKRGLSRFEPERGTIASYRVSDGLPAGEFEAGSATRTAQFLHFGSLRWVVTVPAGTALPRVVRSPTVIASVQREGEEPRAGMPAAVPDRLEIPYGKWFSVQIAVIDFDPEHSHVHAYSLKGGTEGWTEIGPRPTITFTDLDPGRYTFVARGRDCRGVWTETEVPLRIDVIPPFWMTLWFRLLFAGTVLAVALVSHRVRLNSVERRNRALMQLHEQLRQLSRRLEAAKEEERKHISRELHDDLGPALTAVVINLQLLAHDRNGEKATRRIQDSIDLVDRMVQQIRDLSLDLRPPLLDEMGLLAALKGYMETQAERTGIAIEVDGPESLRDVLDETAITAFRVAQEAVTNAIRHADAKRVGVTLTERDGGLEIRVEDDGKGFDVRAALEDPVTGKNLGLLGMQERARILGGRFDLESAPGAGTRVRLWIPTEAER